MARQPLPPVEPRALQRALRSLQRVTGKEPSRALYLSGRDRAALEAMQVKRNSKLASEILEALLPPLESARNQRRAERLRDALRQAFGERAFQRAAAYREWRRRAQGAAAVASPPVGQRRYLGAGVHVAPFLSRDGNIVLVAVDKESYAGFLAEAGRPTGGMSDVSACAGEFTARELRDEVKLMDEGKNLMEALRGDLREDNMQPQYGEPMFRYGVHHAPWRPWNMPEGHVLVAVDRQSRLVAMMTAQDAPAARHARKELTMLLELLAPESYRDPYDDGCVDDRDCGEDWKRGDR